MNTQEYTCEKTSIRQIPSAFKKITKRYEWNAVNLDLGGGAYDDGTNYLAGLGVTNLILDPYNRSNEHNAKVKMIVKLESGVFTVTCCNVINVIKEQEIRLDVIRQAYEALKNNGKAFFSVYEGDRSSIGKVTTKGWQNNRPIKAYLDEVKQIFPNAEIKHGMIVASK